MLVSAEGDSPAAVHVWVWNLQRVLLAPGSEPRPHRVPGGLRAGPAAFPQACHSHLGPEFQLLTLFPAAFIQRDNDGTGRRTCPLAVKLLRVLAFLHCVCAESSREPVKV